MEYNIEDRVHDDLVLFHDAWENLTVARMVAQTARRELYRLGAILFGEENRIPLVNQQDVQFVHEWGPRFGWTGVPFYPIPNNINQPQNVITQHCVNQDLNLCVQGGDMEEVIQRAHDRLQQFENAWDAYHNAVQAIQQPQMEYEHAAAVLVKATIIPVVNQNHLQLARALRAEFAWFGNAKYPESTNILHFYGVLTPAEAREDEERLRRVATNMRFCTYVHP